MRIRAATLSLAVAVVTSAPLACTVLNDMDGYTGVFADTGGLADTDEPALDTGVKVDSSTTDSGAPKDSATDTGNDTRPAPDTGADTSVTDSMVVDTGTVADTAVPDTIVVGDTGDTGPLGCHVVINEVQTRTTTTAGDEYIELYNPCPGAIDLSNYRVIYRSASNTTDVLVAAIAAGKTIAPSGFFLIGNGSYSTTSDQPFTASGIADDGAAAVRDPSGTQLDSVAWGSVVSGHAFIETAAAPKPVAGNSISRVPNGTDTNNNSVDFRATAATPKS